MDVIKNIFTEQEEAKSLMISDVNVRAYISKMNKLNILSYFFKENNNKLGAKRKIIHGHFCSCLFRFFFTPPQSLSFDLIFYHHNNLKFFCVVWTNFPNNFI